MAEKGESKAGESATFDPPKVLNVSISVDPEGRVMIQGDKHSMSALANKINTAIRRLTGGDGSITVPRQSGKGKVSPCTIVAYEPKSSS